MQKKFITSLLPALLLALIASGCGQSTSENTPPPSNFNGDVNFKLPAAKDQKLPAYGPATAGEVLPIRPRQGKLMIVFFGFTSCPDVCPTTMGSTGAAVRLLPKADQKQVEGAMISVDPARDSGPALKRYVGKFFNAERAWGFRTDDIEALRKVERAFGASSEAEGGGGHEEHGDQASAKPGNYDVSHSPFRYAVNQQGEVVLMWQQSATSEDVAEDIKRLLAGATAAQPATK